MQVNFVRFGYQKERCFEHMLCLFSLIFVLQITMNLKIGNTNQTYPILIDWLIDVWSAGSSDITFKGNPLKMIQAKFGLNWPSGFRGEDF
jgi:hypothetical protein